MPRSALLRIVLALLPWLGAAVALPMTSAAQFADAEYLPIDRHFAAIPTPPDSGTYPPAVQAAIIEGYRQLAMVTGPPDDAHLDAAKASFERALESDPQAAHAWNGMGIYELTKDEHWLVVLESVKKIFDRDHISMATKAFDKALAARPDLHAARYNLALAYRQARGEENYQRAVQELRKLVAEAPGFADGPLLLGVTYRDAGDLAGLIAMAESLPGGAAFPPAGRQLLLAYALFNSDRLDEGAAAYRAGVEAITDLRAAELYWQDILPIISPETDARFRAFDVEGRKTYLRDFWQSLADASFVTADARLAEHYRRLHRAYENYRLEIPERRHYAASAAYVPPWQTGFDDRGVIFLRHGEPDEIATYSGPDVEQNVSWMYERATGDPLVFHFVSAEDVQDFKLVRRLEDAIISNSTKMTGQTTFNPQCGEGGRCDRYDARIVAGDRREMRDLYASRGHLDPYYDRAATGLDPQILEREETNLAQDIAIGTGTQSFTPDPSASPLLYPVYPVPFRNPGGVTAVAFYYALPTTEVSIVPRAGGGSQVDYSTQLLLQSPGEEAPVSRQEDDAVISSSGSIPRDPGSMLPVVRTVELGPGEYQYGLKVTDLNSGRSGITRGSVTVGDVAGPGLALSGIVLAARVEPATDASGPFTRWGRLKVLTLPSRMFRRSQPVFVYYEVYGLTADAPGSARYRTTYTLESRPPDGNVVARFFSAVGELLTGGEEQGAITYSFERTQDGEIDPLLEYFSLDVSGSPVGAYALRVEVEDLASGAVTRREVELSLVD